MKLEQKRVQCTYCKGVGMVEDSHDDMYGVNTAFTRGCDECDGEGTRMEYTDEDLLLACQHHNLEVSHTDHKQIMRMRCIMALRGAGLMD